MRLAKSLTNRDMQITFTFLNTLWKSEKGRMRKEHMNIKKEGKQIRHIGQRFGRKHVIALSFFMPLIVMTGCCIAFGIQPFGDNSLLIIDGLHQYMPFYSVLYDKLKGGESLFYSFRSGLGINFLSLFSYYLSSPLNLLIIFFKKTQLNMADFDGVCIIKLHGWLLLECYVAGCDYDFPNCCYGAGAFD